MLLDALLSPFRALHTMRELGGPLVDWIFATCVIMWCISIERYWYFTRILPKEPECPVCTSIEFQRCPPRARDGVLRLVNLVPLQCTNCWRYFYWMQNDQAITGNGDRHQWSN